MVDGVLAEIGQKVDPDVAHIEVDGVPLPVRPDLAYLLLYKPVGVVTTMADPNADETVVDLVPKDPRVHPVGRLDADSEGLLLLTNDGDLTNLVTHPRHGVTKTYVALVEGLPGTSAVKALTDGVDLDDGRAAAVSARVTAETQDRSTIEIVMREGRNREVRRMCAAIGHPVIGLVRIAIGPLRDRTLKPGTWRHLTISEVRSVYEAGGGPWQDADNG